MPSSLVSRIRTLHPPWSIVQLLAPEDVVVVLGEAVGLVADVLEQAQGGGVPAQAQRLRRAGAVDLLLALGQRQQAGRLDAEHPERLQGGVQLPLAAVDQEHVGKDLPLLLTA